MLLAILEVMNKSLIITWLTVLLTATSGLAWYPRLSQEMILGAETAIIGRNRAYIVAPGETLMELAWRAGVGFDNLLRANPGVDPWNPPPGEPLILPQAALPLRDLQPGVTINLAELRLYLLWDEAGTRMIRIYPVGIGRAGWETPLGEFQVSVLIDNPAWTPPESLRQEKPWLPAMVLPGPDNPLGSHWIGLTAAGTGIHGSNQPLGVGRRVSHGCIRLYPRDIVDLVGRVQPGTTVRIVDQPVKWMVHNGSLYLEVHRRVENPALLDLPAGNWDREALAGALFEASGLQVIIKTES